MILHILRALFVLLMAAVGYFGISLGLNPFTTWPITITLAVLIVCIDILAPRRKVVIFSGTFLGLIVGLVASYALSFVVAFAADQWLARYMNIPRDDAVRFMNVMVGCVCSFFAISFILQTKDDFRFIIPYVEFARKTKGARPILLDTSVLIDGRISDIAATGILETQLVVPRFVLLELQAIADSADKLKRARGRRGLDMLQKMKENGRTDIIQYDSSAQDDSSVSDVDEKLLQLAISMSARVLTNDFNLNKVAQLRGVDVININDLANAMRPNVLPGEKMVVRLLKPGDQPDQGVGFLDDGTMVVVEQGRGHLNEEVEFLVTNTRQTSAGRMIFGRLHHENGGGQRRPAPQRRDESRASS
jgi:uncharacterized protein YacL